MASVAMEMAVANYRAKAARANNSVNTEQKAILVHKGKTLYTVRRAKP